MKPVGPTLDAQRPNENRCFCFSGENNNNDDITKYYYTTTMYTCIYIYILMYVCMYMYIQLRLIKIVCIYTYYI